MSGRSTSVLAGLALCATLLPTPASAQVPWYGVWQGMSVQFNYNDASFTTGTLALGTDFAPIRNHLTSAAFTWLEPGCTVLSMSLGSSTSSFYQHGMDTADFENVLYYETNLDNWRNFNHADETIYGNTHYTRDTNLPWYIADTDIIFNGTGIVDQNQNGTDWIVDGTNATRIDFESVALHEMGHALGLLHDGTAGESIMYPSINSGDVHRSLRQADVAAVCLLYPNPFSMAGMSAECTTDHDCATGTCATIGTLQSCQYRCAGDCDCPSGNACAPTATAGVSVCQAGTNSCPPSSGHALAQNGATCAHGIDCLSSLCLHPPTGMPYCSRPCSSDCDCNAGFACSPTEGICVTTTATTHCMPDAGVEAHDAGTTHDGGASTSDGGTPPASHGGCSVRQDTRGSYAWILAIGAALALTRRRRVLGRR